MSSNADHIDPLASPRQTVPFIAIDPFLGRDQHWLSLRLSLVDSLYHESDCDDSSPLPEEITRYLDLPKNVVRSFLLLESNRDRATQILAQLVHEKDHFRSNPSSVTFVRHQPRLASLPLLVRKTAIELSSALNLRLPPPTENEDIYRWFRSVLNQVSHPAIVIWDGVDLADDLESGDPWFWLTSPLPANIRLILSAAPSELTKTWQTRGMETLSLKPAPTMDTPLPSFTPLQEEILALIGASRGGRSSDELADLFPNANDAEITDALGGMNHLLGFNDRKRWFLREKKDNIVRADSLDRISEWLRGKPEESDTRLWEYPHLLAERERWDELVEMFSRPANVWRWWNHYRADIIRISQQLIEKSNASFATIADQARLVEDFRPHHALAYAALLMATNDHAAALEHLRKMTEAQTGSDQRLHLYVAKRRAVECARHLGDLNLAWDLLQSLEREVPLSADFRTRGQLKLLAGELLIQRKEWHQAYAPLQEVEEEAQKVGLPWFEAEALRLQAESAAAESNNAALSTIDSKLLAHARSNGWDFVHLAPLRREIKRKLASEDGKGARDLSLQLQETAARLADIDALGESLGTLAMLENREGRYREMATILAAKERLCREVGDLPGVIDLLLSRAVAVGFRLNDRDSARSLAEDALRWGAELNDLDRQTKAKQLLERLDTSS
ncbi:hypothetical protein K2Y11_16760 [bacterium]|nr:hypothetical protein [bacterium]